VASLCCLSFQVLEVDQDADLRVAFADGRRLCLHPEAVSIAPGPSAHLTRSLSQGSPRGLFVGTREPRSHERLPVLA
jgi:hypothetical protein